MVEEILGRAKAEAEDMTIDPGGLAQQIRQIASKALTEEDLRIGVEHALSGIRNHLGILPRYERTYADTVSIFGGGSADAVYGHAVIEYKRPGRLSRTRDVREAVGELTKYLYGEAARQGGDVTTSLRRTIGIALDGQKILFLRYRGQRRVRSPLSPVFPGMQLPLFEETDLPAEFQKIGPIPVTAETIEQFLLYLRALRRRPSHQNL